MSRYLTHVLLKVMDREFEKRIAAFENAHGNNQQAQFNKALHPTAARPGSPQHRSNFGRPTRCARLSPAGVRRLYLYTPGAEEFYLRLGWALIEHTYYRGMDVAVMSYECPA